MTRCWSCQRTEIESGHRLESDGAHRDCPHPEPAPSTYVPPKKLLRPLVPITMKPHRYRHRRPQHQEEVAS